MSDSTDRARVSASRFVPGPEASHVVAAVAALMVDDREAAKIALRAAIEITSWDVVEHRIEVVGRALLVDADLEPSRGPHPDEIPVDAAAPSDDQRWAAAWSGLGMLADLVERAGYPPEVLA